MPSQWIDSQNHILPISSNLFHARCPSVPKRPPATSHSPGQSGMQEAWPSNAIHQSWKHVYVYNIYIYINKLIKTSPSRMVSPNHNSFALCSSPNLLVWSLHSDWASSVLGEGGEFGLAMQYVISTCQYMSAYVSDICDLHSWQWWTLEIKEGLWGSWFLIRTSTN